MKTHQPARIVVIEDNPGDVLLLRHALDAQPTEYQLEVLEDGEQALSFIREFRSQNHEPTPCVLVLDLYLPKYDGFAVLKTIRREPALAGLNVVALTGATSAEEEAEIRNLGVRLYRKKPTDIDELWKLGEEIMAVCNESAFRAAV